MLLEGVRVLDLSFLLPGGYCTRLLADAGAEVKKIEPPAGDPLRGMPGGAAYFGVLHAGKQLLTLDLKTEEGREQLRKEVDSASVLVEGFRPGVMDRNGVGYEALAARNPRLVYCAITGYGSAGPLANRAGHDLNYLARSGALTLMPQAEGKPVIPGLPIADLAGGLDAAFLVACALIERDRTGHGGRVEVSMNDLMRGWAALPRAARKEGVPVTALTGELPCYHVYGVRDGFLSVAALEPRFWAEFCRAIGREDLEARQGDPGAIPEVAGILASRTRAEWMATFGDRDVCVEPCLRIDEEDR